MSLHLAAILLLLSYFVQLQYFYYALSSLRITGWYSEMRTPAKILDHQNYAGYRSKFFLGVKWFCSCRKEQKKKKSGFFVCLFFGPVQDLASWKPMPDLSSEELQQYKYYNSAEESCCQLWSATPRILQPEGKKKQKPNTVTFRKQNLCRARVTEIREAPLFCASRKIPLVNIVLALKLKTLDWERLVHFEFWGIHEWLSLYDLPRQNLIFWFLQFISEIQGFHLKFPSSSHLDKYSYLQVIKIL